MSLPDESTAFDAAPCRRPESVWTRLDSWLSACDMLHYSSRGYYFGETGRPQESPAGD